ncbi:choloylglycine hydrolase family protein [Bacteroides gallinaceum]|nr:choloylglycine hydrolase family protein [Bacteroides gallinaceum]MDM8207649.1 choloylglycine hydrolase family protein [Bacteroides gallinaceum]
MILGMLGALAVFLPAGNIAACTGISLAASDSSRVVARTIEWGGSDLNSQYVIVPRGYVQQSYIPGGVAGGKKFSARYGYVGLAVEQKEFVAEGLNEAGLSAGLFYFPGYGGYVAYDESEKAESVADLQLVSYILATCATVDEVKKAVGDVRVVAIDPRASTVHWRFAEPSGRQLVLEIVDGRCRFYENKLGVLTNSPDFEWQLTNLNNYVNLFPGTAPAQRLGNLSLKSFGAGSGFLGIPGDVTPPSRFVRAAFYQSTAPLQKTGEDAVLQCFQILNNFDIPVGIETAAGEVAADIPSATQWTSATDVTHRVIYFRTMHNSAIRRIDLKRIDFSKVGYKAVPLDMVKRQPIIDVL